MELQSSFMNLTLNLRNIKMLDPIKNDEEFQREYFELYSKYKAKHEATLYTTLYNNVMDILDDIKNKFDFITGFEGIAHLVDYPEDNSMVLDPENRILYFISDGILKKIDSKGIELVTITPELFKYFSKRKFFDVCVKS